MKFTERMLAAFAVTSVLSVTTPIVHAADAPIEVGVMGSFSGPVGAQGSAFANAAKLAVEEINKNGGIKAIGGRQLHITTVDDTSVPATARTLAIKLINDNKVSAIVGPYGSGVCMAVGPVIEQQGLPTICSGTSDTVTQQGYTYLFNVGTLGSTYVTAFFKAFAGISKETGKDIKKVAVLYEDGAFGTNGFKQAEANAKSAGFELTTSVSFRSGTPDLSPVVNRAVGSGAQAILAVAFTGDVINIVRSVKTMKAPLLVAALSSNAIDPQIVKLGDIAEGIIGLTDWNEDVAKPGVAAFREKYKAAYGDYPNPSAPPGWSAMYFLKEALEKAGSADPEKLRQAIADLKVKDGPVLDVQPYNSFGFDKDGLGIDLVDRVIAAQLQHGKFVTVWPESVATAKFDLSALK